MTTRGYYQSYYDFDFPNALASYERAIELDPAYPTAHQWYAETLMTLRREPEALEQIRIAVELDPLAPIVHHVFGWIVQNGDKPLDAIPHYETVLKLNPNIVGTLGNLSGLYMELGDFDKARFWIRQWGEKANLDVSVDLAVVDALENPALRQNAIKRLQDSPDHIDGAGFRAVYFMLMGEKELALQSLETGLENGDTSATQVNSMRAYEVLRDNPRFQAHLKKMNLWP